MYWTDNDVCDRPNHAIPDSNQPARDPVRFFVTPTASTPPPFFSTFVLLRYVHSASYHVLKSYECSWMLQASQRCNVVTHCHHAMTTAGSPPVMPGLSPCSPFSVPFHPSQTLYTTHIFRKYGPSSPLIDLLVSHRPPPTPTPFPPAPIPSLHRRAIPFLAR